MKGVTNDELIRSLMQENQELKHQTIVARSDVDYIAMMTDVELDPEEEAASDE